MSMAHSLYTGEKLAVVAQGKRKAGEGKEHVDP
jgi:hypothetical protein